MRELILYFSRADENYFGGSLKWHGRLCGKGACGRQAGAAGGSTDP